jgi:hypothetical protein
MSGIGTIPASIEPFRIGNVVKASVRLYRDRFKLYLGIGLRAILWLFLPVLVAIPIMLLCFLLVLLTNSVNGQSTLSWLFSILLILMTVFVPLSCVYVLAKYYINIALISRLTFYELNSHPETENQAHWAIYRKFWMLCILQFLLIFVFSSLNGFNSVIQNILEYTILDKLNNNIALVVLNLLINFLWYMLYFWISARFQIADTSLVLESNLNALKAIARSWYLTKGYAWKIIGVGIVIFALLFPAYLLALIPLAIGLGSKGSALLTTLSSPQLLIDLWPYYLASWLLFVVIAIVTLPLWSVVKGVIYYGLRARKEGLDLTVREHHSVGDDHR